MFLLLLTSIGNFHATTEDDHPKQKFTYRIQETEMKRRGSNDSGGFWMGNPAAGTPKKLPGVQHCLEVRRLSETHGVVVFCVEHFGFFTECAFEEGWGCHESDRCELQVTEADLALQVSFYVTTRSSNVDGLRTYHSSVHRSRACGAYR